MKNNTILKDIYSESKGINRNLQRISTIGLISLLSTTLKEAKEKDDENVVAIGKIGMMALALAQVLLFVSDIDEIIHRRKERKLDAEYEED